ncbi:hypothetical protein [Myxococcus qinghaiensis]|uniref:hypothetical protein n=1 Tax=Myxococcus qinghaiensis TaxID=2906758 RepID=UPI0020A80417|nr:hypothetical protein [Myxococcus qinghaiensis]MCP3169731.1 hypothetical protein [Myxococcus qinghaiensis]
MSNHYPRIRLTYVELLLVREGLSLVFFMDRPHQEVAQAVIAAMEAYLQAIGPTAIGRYASEDGEWIVSVQGGWAAAEGAGQQPAGGLSLADAA